MPLEEYRRKRKFQQTPEPAGVAPAPPRGRSFVVQMHSARRLHYDLRLEVDGVLKSWAVPKGPSLNPADKRLAVMTEDHPLDYGGFEGVIPAGNYGAGPVMVWDTGIYHLEGSGEAAVQIARGEVKFSLDGRRLGGGFVLVRTKRGQGNEWLLIKHHDEYSDPAWDIEGHARSAISGRTLEEIEEGAPLAASPDQIEGAQRAPLPAKIEPMLATLLEDPFSDPGWLFELKWDGMRAIARVDDGRLELWSRTGRHATERFPELAVLPERLGARQAILDGEIVVLDPEGRSSFERMQSRMHVADPSPALLQQAPVLYYLFDVLYCDGYDLRGCALLDRKHYLRRLLNPRPPLRYCDHVIEQGRELYELARQRGLEGIIGKRLASRYSSARSPDWVKLKITHQVDAVIGGYTAARGGQRFGALLLGLYKGGDLEFVGGVGTGFSEATQEKVFAELEKRRVARCPFSSDPAAKERAFWVKPELVARVKFSEWTGERRLRAPVFLGLRSDLEPGDCRAEAEGGGAMPPAAPAVVVRAITTSPVVRRWEDLERELAGGRAAHVVAEIEGRPFRLSNLNKVYYPKESYTKRRLLYYYYQVAETILPFLRNRPMVLRRTPDGIGGGQFFQKDAGDDAPAWMSTYDVYSEERRKNTRNFLCNDKASLLHLTNLGCIEHNPWSSTIEDTEHPDYLFFDLDPGESAEFRTVVEVAAAIHALLQKIKLQAYLKISGATGFHIYTPLELLYTSEQVRAFTEIVARVIAVRMPQQVTLERSMAKRDAAKVYIDFAQNGRTRPLTCPYSARPFPGATVSAPVSAKELKPDLSALQFTITTVPERLARLGDLWGDFFRSRQRLEPALERLRGGAVVSSQ